MKELILNFHGVGQPPLGTDPMELKYWWEEAPFLAALDNIAAAGRTSSIPTLITFDDGNMSDARIATPAIVERGLKATFFVCAGRIGIPGYLDRAAIKDMLQAGMTIGSHGMHHVDWRRTSDAELDEEVSGARHILEKACGQEIHEAGIPFGSYDRRVIKKLKQEGWRHVYTSDGGFARRGSWMKTRNTLDQGYPNTDFIGEIDRRDTFFSRLKRQTSCFYKRLR